MEKSVVFGGLVSQIEPLLDGDLPRDQKLAAVCRLLAGGVSYYNWVGFYIVSADGKSLRLGPYVGAPTDHVEIPFGRGICGQAAQTKETFVVQDVSKETNYLSCSIHVKSEIVIPIIRDGRVLAELDIDSHEVAPFTALDRDFLEGLCRKLEKVFQ